MAPTLRPSRTVATLSAALLLGAAGGAGATLLIDDGGSPAPTQAATGQPVAVATQDGDVSTVNAVYKQSRQGVVDITVKTPSGTAQLMREILENL